MKKKYFKIYSLALFLFFLVLFSACNKENDIQIEREEFQKSYYLSSDTTCGQLKVDLDIEFLVAHDDTAAMRKIQSQINEKYIFADDFSSSSNQEILVKYGDILSKEYIDNNLSDFLQQKESDDFNFLFLYDHEFSLRTQFLPEVKHLISYCAEYYSYTGGAHGISYKLYSNYNLKNGELITEKDLFVDNSEQELSRLLREQLVREDDEVVTEEDLEGRFWSDKIEANENFYITESGITYVYNPYEIAPYSMGIIEIDLPFTVLRDIIKKNSPIKALL